MLLNRTQTVAFGGYCHKNNEVKGTIVQTLKSVQNFISPRMFHQVGANTWKTLFTRAQVHMYQARVTQAIYDTINMGHSGFQEFNLTYMSKLICL